MQGSYVSRTRCENWREETLIELECDCLFDFLVELEIKERGFYPDRFLLFSCHLLALLSFIFYIYTYIRLAGRLIRERKGKKIPILPKDSNAHYGRKTR